MILNAYSIIDGLICLLRLPLSLLVIGLSIGALRSSSRRSTTLASQESREDRGYLLIVVAVTLLVLNVVAWPLFYLMLQSYVPQWRGVMCIYGVTQIGSHGTGMSRWLPDLLVSLQVLKPAVLFASGAWLALYLANRRTRTSSLFSRIVVLLLAFGVLSATDAVVESAYLVIPKVEQHLSAGCCVGLVNAADSATSSLTDFAKSGYLPVAYWLVNGAMVGVLFYQQSRPSRMALGALLAGALISIPVNLIYLIHFAAPTILHLPYHHCAYDLLARFPETGVGVGFFLLGVFSVGWAVVVAWLGRHEQTRTYLNGFVGRLLYMAGIGYLASMILFSVELVLC